MSIDDLHELARNLDGKIEEVTLLPDGTGFATMIIPLPKDHWIFNEEPVEPPMPFQVGTDDPRRRDMAERIREAGKYAVRGATMNGQEMDFDPDALLQNLVVGMLGYCTPDGLSHIDDAQKAKK